ncbi:hypothetical protein HYH03_003227 [Edaphochlamys debaryana]|uniref:CobB/CobQ-like glutamine amidotransferase domain-containing protein n=1 Tax=Edaphochlamys debaryana TaxID=47281 RepID=A0A835YCI0_9CHLO|nr:hypothetical protein HYH03_003227 [Edaphochlamys debaryana]|eukprot:KAG2499042.1 hypothetical protein HYH03_003227 [Edaphochlamys debaryana]
MRALFLVSRQPAVEGWVAALQASGAPLRHITAWSAHDDLRKAQHGGQLWNVDPFLLGAGTSLESALAAQPQPQTTSADTLLLVSLDPALPSGQLLPRSGVVLLVWQPQVPADIVAACAGLPSALTDGSCVRGILLVDPSPSLTLSVTHKALEGAGLAALARKPTVLAGRTSAAPAVAFQSLLPLSEPLPPPPSPTPMTPTTPHHGSGGVRIAVARDDAFGPVFHENLALLHQAGAQLLFFSPLYDTCLPSGATCLYLCGGPLDAERWQQLAANRPLLAAVRAFCDAGGLALAEGAGLLYLARTVELDEGDGAHHHRVHDMAGVFPFKTRLLPDPRTAAVQLEAQPGNPLLPVGSRPRGYMCAQATLVLVEERQLLGLAGLGGGHGAGGKGAANHFATTYSATVLPQPGEAAAEGMTGAEGPLPEGYTLANTLASSCFAYLGSEPGLASQVVRRAACVDAAALTSAMAAQLGCSAAALSSAKAQLGLAAALASSGGGSRGGSRRQSTQDVPAWFGSNGCNTSNTSSTSGMHGHGHGHSHHAASGGLHHTHHPLGHHPHHHHAPHAHSHHQHALSLPPTPVPGTSGTGAATSPHHYAEGGMPHSSSSSALSSGAAHLQPSRRSVGYPVYNADAYGWRGSEEPALTLARQQALLQQSLAAAAASTASSCTDLAAADHNDTACSTDVSTAGACRPCCAAAGAPPGECSDCAADGSVSDLGRLLSGPCEPLATVLERSSSCNSGVLSTGVSAAPGAVESALSRPPPVMHHASSAGSLSTLHQLTRRSMADETLYGAPPALAWANASHASSGHGYPWIAATNASNTGPSLNRHSSAGMIAQQHMGAPPPPHAAGVVCCAPGACEALVAMGLGNRLAGIGSDCDHPPDVCASRRVVLAWVPADQAPQGAAARGIRVVPPPLPPALGRGAGERGGRNGGGGGRVLLVDELALRQEPPGVLVLQDPGELTETEWAQLELALVETGLICPGGGAAVMHVSCRSLVDVMDLILELGAAAGEPQAASMLLERLQARLRRVAAAAAGAAAQLAGGAAAAAAAVPLGLPATIATPRCPRVLVLQSLAPLVEPGRWVPEMLAMAGASSCLALPGGADVPLSWSDLRERAAPDVLIILTPPADGPPGGGASMAAHHAHAHAHGSHAHAGSSASHANSDGGAGNGASLNEQLAALAAQPGWWCLPAVRSSQVYLLQAAYCTRAGPRLVDGVELLARLLVPGGGYSSNRKVPASAVMRLGLAAGQRCRASLLPSYFVPMTF